LVEVGIGVVAATRSRHFRSESLVASVMFGSEGSRRIPRKLRSVRDFARKEWPPSGAVRLT
jgi:hypothetical protein